MLESRENNILLEFYYLFLYFYFKLTINFRIIIAFLRENLDRRGVRKEVAETGQGGDI